MGLDDGVLMPVNRNKKSPRFGLSYTVDKDTGSHVYVNKRTGKVTRIGGKKAAPYDPGAPLTGKSFDREVEAQVNYRYGDELRDLDSQQRIQSQSRVNTDAAWKAYQGMLAGAHQQQQTFQQQQQAQLAAQNQQLAASAEQQRAAMQAQADPSRAARGFQGPSAVEATAQQAQQANAARGQAQQALLTQQGASQNQFNLGQQSIGAGIRALELGKEDARARAIVRKRQDTLAEAGDFRVKARGGLRQGEREWQAAQATFRLNAANTQQDNALAAAQAAANAADKEEQRRIARERIATTRRGQDMTDARARDPKVSGGGKGKRAYAGYGGTNVSLDKATSNLATFENYRGGGIPQQGINTNYLKAIGEQQSGKYGKGRVSKKTAQKIFKLYGFRIKYGAKKKPVLNRPVGSRPG